MKQRQKVLTDEEWELIEPLLREPKRRRDHRGRPCTPNRACFAGILWILLAGEAWRFLTDEFLSLSTCWRRLQQWEEECVWLEAWRALLEALDAEGLLKWDETFPDGSFAPAKKGASPSIEPSAARARSRWNWSTVTVFPWEFGWEVPLRQKLRLRKPRSLKSTSRNRRAVRGKSTNA